jgi:hypothetical protein
MTEIIEEQGIARELGFDGQSHSREQNRHDYY